MLRGSAVVVFICAVCVGIALLPSPAPAASGPVATASDYDCADFANQAEAEEYLLPGDPYRLDADHDGIACEDLPCPCSSSPGSGGGGGGGGAEPAKPPPPPELDKGYARALAEGLARSFVSRSPLVDELHFRGCGRRSREKIACAFLARGKSPTETASCGFRVSVRGQGHRGSARLRHPRCSVHRRPSLSYARAKEALSALARRLGGAGAHLIALERRSRTLFAGQVEWIQGPKAARESCYAELTARALPSGRVGVNYFGRECEGL